MQDREYSWIVTTYGCLHTRHRRGQYTTLCIQVPIDEPLTTAIFIGNHHQRIFYEGINLLCYHCSRIGHSSLNCSYKNTHITTHANDIHSSAIPQSTTNSHLSIISPNPSLYKQSLSLSITPKPTPSNPSATTIMESTHSPTNGYIFVQDRLNTKSSLPNPSSSNTISNSGNLESLTPISNTPTILHINLILTNNSNKHALTLLQSPAISKVIHREQEKPTKSHPLKSSAYLQHKDGELPLP